MGAFLLIISPLLSPNSAQSQTIVAQTESDREKIIIHNYYTSPPFEEIYYYAIETDKGLILIDTECNRRDCLNKMLVYLVYVTMQLPYSYGDRFFAQLNISNS